MSASTVKTLFELLDENPTQDRSQIFEQLWGIMGELRAKVDARFNLTPDPSVADLQPMDREMAMRKDCSALLQGKRLTG